MLPGTVILEEVSIPISKKKKLLLDIFLTKHRVAVEVNGGHHRKRVGFFQTRQQFNKQVENDKQKREWANINGIHLIELWFDEGTDRWEQKIREVLFQKAKCSTT